MTRTPSTMTSLGMSAPGFTLDDHNPRTDTGSTSLKDLQGPEGTLVVFLCNHCPYVKHIEDELARLADRFQADGIHVIGIASNDTDQYPDDGPDGIAEQCERAGFTFPYLLDETQDVAKAYSAACTPDFFLFDENLELYYRGQFDDARPGNDEPVTGEDLEDSADRLLEDQDPPSEQHPSHGCNIKWTPGNEPEYA